MQTIPFRSRRRSSRGQRSARTTSSYACRHAPCAEPTSMLRKDESPLRTIRSFPDIRLSVRSKRSGHAFATEGKGIASASRGSAGRAANAVGVRPAERICVPDSNRTDVTATADTPSMCRLPRPSPFRFPRRSTTRTRRRCSVPAPSDGGRSGLRTSTTASRSASRASAPRRISYSPWPATAIRIRPFTSSREARKSAPSLASSARSGRATRRTSRHSSSRRSSTRRPHGNRSSRRCRS